MVVVNAIAAVVDPGGCHRLGSQLILSGNCFPQFPPENAACAVVAPPSPTPSATPARSLSPTPSPSSSVDLYYDYSLHLMVRDIVLANLSDPSSALYPCEFYGVHCAFGNGTTAVV